MIPRALRFRLTLSLLSIAVPLAAIGGERDGFETVGPSLSAPSPTVRPANVSNVLHDNFDGDRYNTGAGWTVSAGNSTPQTDWDQGESFTVPPDSNYTLDTVDIALTIHSGTNRVEVLLMSDNNGEPGTVLETMVATNIGDFQQVDPPITLNSTGTVLTAGRTYWLIAHAPEGSATHVIWNANVTGDNGSHIQRQNLGPWNLVDSLPHGAFRVCATPRETEPCPLVETLNAVGDHVSGLLAKSNSNKDRQLQLLSDLRSYRDSVMKTSAAGRELTRLYYRHGMEMTRILKQNPVLAWKTVQVVSRAMPAVRTATKGQTPVEVDSVVFRQGVTLLTEIEQLASDDLRNSLRSARTLLGQHAVVNAGHVVVDLNESNALKVVASE